MFAGCFLFFASSQYSWPGGVRVRVACVAFLLLFPSSSVLLAPLSLQKCRSVPMYSNMVLLSPKENMAGILYPGGGMHMVSQWVSLHDDRLVHVARLRQRTVGPGGVLEESTDRRIGVHV